jgi:azurin
MRWILGTALVAGFALSGAAQAQDCAATIDGNDAIQFSASEMTVSSSCESFTVTLRHVGSLAANIMGHNWVLTTTANYESVAMAGQSAGADNNFVPPGDARVIAATAIIGGGEETSVTFDASALEAGGNYTYFCSFPGHYVLMKGKLIVE